MHNTSTHIHVQKQTKKRHGGTDVQRSTLSTEARAPVAANRINTDTKERSNSSLVPLWCLHLRLNLAPLNGVDDCTWRRKRWDKENWVPCWNARFTRDSRYEKAFGPFKLRKPSTFLFFFPGRKASQAASDSQDRHFCLQETIDKNGRKRGRQDDWLGAKPLGISFLLTRTR